MLPGAEPLGSGTLLDMKSSPPSQMAGGTCQWPAAVSASAFFIIGLFIWAIRSWKTDQVEEPEFEIAPNGQYKEAI